MTSIRPHILFVDDDPFVISGLRAALRKQRLVWELTFVTSGAAALEELARQPVDVVVTDMRMPGMDGVELLEHVRAIDPAIPRIVLTGFAERTAMMRAYGLAHHLLDKPIEAKHLQEVIVRACTLRTILSERERGARLAAFAAPPPLYRELASAVAHPEATGSGLGLALRASPDLCERVVELARRPTIALPALYAAEDVLARVGLGDFSGLVLAAHASFVFGVDASHFDHALEVARRASCSLRDYPSMTRAFVAGLLHDIGELVDPAEHEVTGAHLLALWGVELPIVDAVLQHHAEPVSPIAKAIADAERDLMPRRIERPA